MVAPHSDLKMRTILIKTQISVSFEKSEYMATQSLHSPPAIPCHPFNNLLPVWSLWVAEFAITDFRFRFYISFFFLHKSVTILTSDISV